MNSLSSPLVPLPPERGDGPHPAAATLNGTWVRLRHLVAEEPCPIPGCGHIETTSSRVRRATRILGPSRVARIGESREIWTTREAVADFLTSLMQDAPPQKSTYFEQKRAGRRAHDLAVRQLRAQGINI